MYHLDRSVVDERTFGILAALAAVCVCVCVSVRVHFVCDCAFDSLPVVIRTCIVVCVYFVRKPIGRVHTPKRANESPVKSDSNGDYRWSKVVAANWDPPATPTA